MGTFGSWESLLSATFLPGEDYEDKTQGPPVFVELVRLPKYYSIYSGLRLRAYNALTMCRFYDRVVYGKTMANREWRKVTGSPLPEDTFSKEVGHS